MKRSRTYIQLDISDLLEEAVDSLDEYEMKLFIKRVKEMMRDLEEE